MGLIFDIFQKHPIKQRLIKPRRSTEISGVSRSNRLYAHIAREPYGRLEQQGKVAYIMGYS